MNKKSVCKKVHFFTNKGSFLQTSPLFCIQKLCLQTSRFFRVQPTLVTFCQLGSCMQKFDLYAKKNFVLEKWICMLKKILYSKSGLVYKKVEMFANKSTCLLKIRYFCLSL